jgi:CRP-like cAMP-binding protein
MSFIDVTRRQLEDRLAALRPAVEESRRLEEAISALNDIEPPSKAPARPRPAAKRKAGQPASGSVRRGRPPGSGTRGKQALALVKATPGITIPEIAKEMGIQQNYLYRVLPRLQKDGLVRRQGRGWHSQEVASS